MGIIVNILISGLAVWISAYVLPGVHVDGFLTAVMAGIIIGIVNVILKPILVILTLPITLVTLGLFTFVINGLLILLVSHWVKGFRVDGFLWAIIFSLVLSVVNSFLHGLAK